MSTKKLSEARAYKIMVGTLLLLFVIHLLLDLGLPETRPDGLAMQEWIITSHAFLSSWWMLVLWSPTLLLARYWENYNPDNAHRSFLGRVLGVVLGFFLGFVPGGVLGVVLGGVLGGDLGFVLGGVLGVVLGGVLGFSLGLALGFVLGGVLGFVYVAVIRGIWDDVRHLRIVRH